MSSTHNVGKYKVDISSKEFQIRKKAALITTVIFSHNKKQILHYHLYFRPLSGYKSYGWIAVQTGSEKYLYFSGKKNMMQSFLARLKRDLHAKK